MFFGSSDETDQVGFDNSSPTSVRCPMVPLVRPVAENQRWAVEGIRVLSSLCFAIGRALDDIVTQF